MVFGLGLWACGENKGRGVWFWVRARRLGQGDLARSAHTGRVAKIWRAGFWRGLKFGRVFVCSHGVRGVCGLRIVDYIFLARIENRIAGRTRCGRIKK